MSIFLALTPYGKQCAEKECTAKFDDGGFNPGPPRCTLDSASGANCGFSGTNCESYDWDYCTTCKGEDCLTPVLG